MSARPAERQHLRPGAERRHHHQTLARTAGEEPAGGTSHRRKRHPAGSTVIGTKQLTKRDSIITVEILYFANSGAKTACKVKDMMEDDFVCFWIDGLIYSSMSQGHYHNFQI